MIQELVKKIIDFFRGAWRSWTIWFGAFLSSQSLWFPHVEPMLTGLFGPISGGMYTAALGIIVLALRIKTNQSISSKAK